MEKKFSWLLTLLVSMMSFVMTSCGEDDDDYNIGGETYCYFGEEKWTLSIASDAAEVYFYPENESAIREELGKHNLTLGDTDNYLRTNRLDQYTEAGRNLYVNLMAGTVFGKYKDIKSVLKHAVAWSPFYYKNRYLCVFPDPSISFVAKARPGVEYRQVARLAEENNVIITLIDEDNDTSTTDYLFACTNESKANAVEMSVKFYNSRLFERAEPYFGTIDEPFGNL